MCNNTVFAGQHLAAQLDGEQVLRLLTAACSMLGPVTSIALMTPGGLAQGQSLPMPAPMAPHTLLLAPPLVYTLQPAPEPPPQPQPSRAATGAQAVPHGRPMPYVSVQATHPYTTQSQFIIVFMSCTTDPSGAG